MAGAPRKIKSPAEMARLWEEFKERCDNYQGTLTEFSQRQGDFCTKEVRKKITYTVEGFCVFLGLGRQNFYATYDNDPLFHDIVTRMREECELDARAKFESGTIPHQLAALWMSKHGYSVKAETKTTESNELLQSLIDLERGRS